MCASETKSKNYLGQNSDRSSFLANKIILRLAPSLDITREIIPNEKSYDLIFKKTFK